MIKYPDLATFVCSTIALACNRDPASVSPRAGLLDLHMDSLTLVSVLAQVEAVYEVSLTPEDTLALVSVTHVSDLIGGLEAIVSRE